MGAPRGLARGGVRGGRRAAAGAPGLARGAGPLRPRRTRRPQRNPGAPHGGRRRQRRGDAAARARLWAPTGSRVAPCSSGTPRAARTGSRLQEAARVGARPGGRPDLRRPNRNDPSIDSAASCVCPERVRKAGGQEVGLLQRGWRRRVGDRAFLIYVSAGIRLLRPKTSGSVSDLHSPLVRHGRAGCLNNVIIH